MIALSVCRNKLWTQGHVGCLYLMLVIILEAFHLTIGKGGYVFGSVGLFVCLFVC